MTGERDPGTGDDSGAADDAGPRSGSDGGEDDGAGTIGASSGRTRRGVLALAGGCTAALAGCSALEDRLGSETETTVAGPALARVVDGEVPPVAEPTPVVPAESHVEAAATRAREALSSVPAPLGPEAIPNGAVRRELTRMHEAATEALDEAAAASSPAGRLAHLRTALEDARGVEAAWRAVDGDLGPENVRADAAPVAEDVRSFREGTWRYVGDDPVRAVLVHGTLERLVEQAIEGVERVRARESEVRRERAPGTPMAVGELAGTLSRARAALEDARHLYARYRDSLAAERDLRATFRRAGATLETALEDRVATLALPEDREVTTIADRDVEGTPVAEALENLSYPLDDADEFDRHRARGKLATVVLSAGESLLAALAFAALRTRVAAGEHVTVERAADVERLRSAAVDGIETVREADRRPELTRWLADWLPDTVSRADEELARYDDDEAIPASSLTRPLGSYVQVAALARESPAAGDAVAAALGAGDGGGG